VVTRSRLLIAALSAALGIVVAAAAGATTVVVPAAPAPPKVHVAAQLLFDNPDLLAPASYDNLRVTIARDGVTILQDAPVPAPADRSVLLKPRMTLADLDGDRTSEVLIDVFTAGADCCRRTAIFAWTGSTFQASVLDWPSSGYRLADLGGLPGKELITRDARFEALAGPYPSGSLPLRILRLQGSELVDATRSFPAALTRDVSKQRQAVKAAGHSAASRSAVVALVADLALLGRHAAASSALDAAGLGSSFSGQVTAALRRWGYA